MNSTEFAYWLQGSLEITYTQSFDKEQTQKIKNHLAMVKHVEKNQMSEFCSWLQGFFDMVEPQELDASQVSKISQKLDACFTHVVANTPQKSPTGFPNQIPKSPRFEAMC